MMRTDQLSRNEVYGLVAEAYAKFYMRPAYIGKMVKSTFTDPNFAWYKKISLKWLKQFCLGGWNMLHSQGISFDLVTKDKAYTNEFKHLTTRGAMKKRYQRFKQLLKQARSVQMVVKSPALNKYLPEQIHSV